MLFRLKRAALAAVFSVCTGSFGLVAGAQTAPAIRVNVDATQAAQKIYHVKVTLPAQPGEFAFVYPKWIPGYHGPTGPIEDVVDMHVSAGGTAIPWRRDLVDFYTVHTTVPPGASSVEVDFDVVGATSQNGQEPPLSTSELAIVEFSTLVVYPQGAAVQTTPVEATLTLPAGWTYGTALPVRARSGDTTSFAPTTLYTLVDSPVLAGAHQHEYPLGENQYLDVASDSDEGARVTPKFLADMKHLVAEGPALYGGKHYRDYHFLLTLSDAIPYEGIEHHESSDNRASEKYASDDEVYPHNADLLPHEYSHSWNGKYRRPADLAPPDFQQPEKTDLLWVYEGMNQYNGEKLAARAGFIGFASQLDDLALSAASMDGESGRTWRPIQDTADGAPFLYVAPAQYEQVRRSAGDFYTEGTLIWLDADVTIRRLTHDEKSLDDFCKLWGNGDDETSVPVFKPYDEAEVIELLNRVVPYDWAGFFKARIATVQPHAPLDGITGGGYHLTYTDRESDLEKERDDAAKEIDARYSIGARIASGGDNDGTIKDVLTDSPAFRAGLAPDMHIVAIDGRRFSGDVLEQALRRHEGAKAPIEMIVSNGDFYTTVHVDAHDGPRYPHLVRDPSVPDELTKIYAPRTYKPTPEASPKAAAGVVPATVRG